jgi:uncharacterized protein YpiB (UPF0302 family)
VTVVLAWAVLSLAAMLAAVAVAAWAAIAHVNRQVHRLRQRVLDMALQNVEQAELLADVDDRLRMTERRRHQAQPWN